MASIGRRLPALTVVLLGLVMSLAAYRAASAWDLRLREIDFERDAYIHIDAIQSKLERILVLIESLGRFFAASESVSADEFALFARFSLERDPELDAIEWLPRVEGAERAAFEREARSAGLEDFAIRDLVDGHLRPAGTRDLYFPILRIEPRRGKASLIGFDPLGDAARGPDFLTAIRTGRPVATAPLPLPQDPEGPRGLEILVPQYRMVSSDSRWGPPRSELLGFAVGMVRIGRFVESVMARSYPQDLDLRLYHRVPGREPALIYVHRAGGGANALDRQVGGADLEVSARLHVAGRSLEVIATPAPGYFRGTGSPVPILIFGLALSLILSVLVQSRWTARNRLRERETRLRMFIEHAPAALAIFDLEMRYLAVSDRWLKDFGLVGETLIGRSHYEVFPDLPERWRLIYRRGLAGEVISAREDPFERADGSRLWLRWEVRPWFERHGQIAGIGIFAEDVTENVQAEQELSRFRQIVETSSEKLIFIDPDTRLRVVNPAYASLYRRTPEQLQGRRVSDLLSAEAWAKVEPHLMAALAGEPQRFQICHRYPEGRLRWMDVEHRPFLLDGAVMGVVVSLHDITEAHEVRAALELQQTHLEEMVVARTAELQAAESQMRLILDSSAGGIFGMDRQGRAMFVNPGACRILGYEPEAIMGREMHALIHHSRPDGQPYPAEECPSILAARESRMIRVDNEVFWRADGRAVPVTYTAHPMVRDGRVTGVVVNFIDMTAQKASERAREAALAEAERLARVRSEFLANMSHEIRTPLNGVLGLARVGHRQSAGRKIQETFDLILSSGQHLLGVVNCILDFSKIEAGKMVLERQRMDLGQVVDQALSLVADQAHGKGLGLAVEEQVDLPRSCMGDALRLSQVLVNLLSNAIKFTERGSVRLSIDRDGDDALVFAITDTGIGLSEEEVSRLFSPFQQADGSTTRRFGGTGLGLSISRRLVELMGGRIEVASRSGEGSRFSVRLPLIEPLEADALPRGRVGLMGLPPEESDRIAGSLKERGLDVATFREGADPAGLDLILTGLTAPESLAALVETGVKIAVYRAGGEGVLPEPLPRRVSLLEAPFRARHLIALMLGEDDSMSMAPRPVERLKDCSVLAAEDNEVNRMVLGQLLEAEGARLVCLEDGAALLEHLARVGDGAYQILLMDIQMPRMDGYRAARRCMELYPDLPVVGLTAHALPEERRRCLESGMVEHVSKPVDIDLLVAVIQDYARSLPISSEPGGANSLGRVRADRAADPESPSPSPSAPDESGVAEDLPLIDLDALNERYRDKPGFVAKLAGVLHRTQSESPVRLRAAVRERDWPQLTSEAHGIKGMSGNLMAWGLHRLAESTERAARDQSPQAFELAERLAEGVEELLRRLPG
ncbi:PAS domain S-box protein [Imhoffiella purpurea]|nr:PAS domain S-box protein [Imhoffiella purpurea]